MKNMKKRTMKRKRPLSLILAFVTVISLLTGGVGNNGVFAVTTAYASSMQTDSSYSNMKLASVLRSVPAKTIGGKFTIMIYMCGTDLESSYGAATNDILEMCNAKLGKNINVLLYTGGTQKWQNKLISSKKNQIWKIENNGIRCIKKDMGKKSMVAPATLTEFIKFCKKNYPAKRNALIMWDHGGAALHGFGSDQYYPNDSMQLDEINNALTKAGMKFDFIGFDACLMATVETAYMLSKHADYMIGSQETEPGLGWYYTNWLKTVNKTPSVSTEKIGKIIVDDFIKMCGLANPADQCTLSVMKLAEMKNVYKALNTFSANARQKIDAKDFKVVSHSVGQTKAFGGGDYDTIDLMDFAQNCDITGAKQLVAAVKKAVVYKKNSQTITKANGMTVYLPYNDLTVFDQMLKVYKGIGLGGEYVEFTKAFANVIAGGQIYIGSSDPFSEHLGNPDGQPDLSEWTKYSWFDQNYVTAYADNYQKDSYENENLKVEEKNGYYALTLSNADWEIVNDIKMQLFYVSDGVYLNLGTDDYWELDEEQAIKVDYDGIWYTIGGRIVQMDVFWTDGEQRTGRIPCKLNGEQVNLVVAFYENGNGKVIGAERSYANGMSMKGLLEVNDGDQIELMFDCYTQNGLEDIYDDIFEYDSSTDTIQYAPSGSGTYLFYYCLTDIYNNQYYTEAVIKEI